RHRRHGWIPAPAGCAHSWWATERTNRSVRFSYLYSSQNPAQKGIVLAPDDHFVTAAALMPGATPTLNWQRLMRTSTHIRKRCNNKKVMVMLSLFKKKPRQVTLGNTGQTFTAEPGETILQAALREGIRFPHSCRVGGCAACKCQL